tara:strand:+ start:516 stop:653 length:138 start_codon:yes stop_codon:yes gene_type:complete
MRSAFASAPLERREEEEVAAVLASRWSGEGWGYVLLELERCDRIC